MSATHGAESAYQQGCRCEHCRAAKREGNRRRRAGRKLLPLEMPVSLYERAWELAALLVEGPGDGALCEAVGRAAVVLAQIPRRRLSVDGRISLRLSEFRSVWFQGKRRPVRQRLNLVTGELSVSPLDNPLRKMLAVHPVESCG